MSPRLFPPSILDIEASGFGAHSYPIEIGVVRHDGARYCRLIKPYPQWQHWDASAQMLHGISQERLKQHGVDGKILCEDLNRFLGTQTAYSDGWVVDHPWLVKLFSAAKVKMSFSLSALEYIMKEPQMARWHEVKQELTANRLRLRHRASEDAKIIQQTFIKTASFKAN